LKPRSAKNKGKLLQNKIRDLILQTFPSLTHRDVQSTTMGDAGKDIKLSEAAFKVFPYDVEAKSFAKFVIYTHYEQRNAPEGERLLIIKGNHKEPLAVVSLKHFMELVRGKD